jgi:hypothetical protein
MAKTATIKEIPDVYTKGFDPTSPDAPGAGDGLPWVNHTCFHIIELVGNDHLAGLLLFHFMFLCRRSRLLIGKKRWYVRSRTDLCHQVRMTRHQYDRALKEIKRLGFVETRRLPFSKMYLFGNVSAFRVTENTIVALKAIIEKRGPNYLKKIDTVCPSSGNVHIDCP